MALSSPLLAASDRINGYIIQDGSNYAIKDNNYNIVFHLSFTQEIAQKQIERLKTGDFASVTAKLDLNTATASVDSVDYVGLSTLLGTWKGNDNLCYDFSGFTSLYTYRPNNSGRCYKQYLYISKKPSRLRKYTYFINPDIAVWNLLFSSVADKYFGELEILDGNAVRIQLFNDQTNATLRTIVLRR